MPDDRFADLGPRQDADADRRPSAAEQLAELDAREPPRPPDARRIQRPYAWVVGVAAVIAIAVVSLKTLPNAGVATHGPPVGRPLPRFAAADALGSFPCPARCDPNIKQSAGDRAAPNRTPACDVRGSGVVNVCELERRPLVITFIGPSTAECDSYVDRLERLRAKFPGTTFMTVVSGRSKSQVAALARRHGWASPVAVDSNFAIEELYHVSLDFCATTTLASRGGVVRANEVPAQRVSDATLGAAIRGAAEQ